MSKVLLHGFIGLSLLAISGMTGAAEKYHAVERDYVTAPNAPASQTDGDVQRKSAGCVSCHTNSDSKNMHSNPAVKLGCVDCHGGDSEITLSENLQLGSAPYTALMEQAHVLPRYPDAWPSSANPERTYT